MVKYEGLFLTQESVEIIKKLENPPLPIINDEIHITFKYKPNSDEIYNDLVGKSFQVYLTGYGNDGANSGFLVELPNDLIHYYINKENDILTIPHLTSSIGDGAEAINTKDLKFKKLAKPVPVTGTFGYWLEEDGKEYLSFLPYKQ